METMAFWCVFDFLNPLNYNISNTNRVLVSYSHLLVSFKRKRMKCNMFSGKKHMHRHGEEYIHVNCRCMEDNFSDDLKKCGQTTIVFCFCVTFQVYRQFHVISYYVVAMCMLHKRKNWFQWWNWAKKILTFLLL